MKRLLPLLAVALCACDPASLPEAECESDLECGEEACVDGRCVAREDRCAPLTTCAAACVDVASNPQHCGGCGLACPPDTGCSGGSCCPAEAPTACGAGCTDVGDDDQNCGGCGVVCGSNLACSNGVCCVAGREFCGGACRDVSSDPTACGACDVVCPLGAACLDGSCAACPAGTEEVACGPIRACLPPDAPRSPCMVKIPEGPFTMGASIEGNPYNPARLVTLSRPYWVDLMEATQADYAPCVAAGACTLNLDRTPFDPEQEPHHPIVWLDWDDADDYCRFRGARLPTEAEWEKAARGGDARAWPWGQEIPPEGSQECAPASYLGCGDDLMPVGTYPDGASPYGVLDLAGNAMEWTADWFAADFYATGPSTDPTGPAEGTEKVRRGGSFKNGIYTLTTFHRHVHAPEHADGESGVRCVMDVP